MRMACLPTGEPRSSPSSKLGSRWGGPKPYWMQQSARSVPEPGHWRRQRMRCWHRETRRSSPFWWTQGELVWRTKRRSRGVRQSTRIAPAKQARAADCALVRPAGIVEVAEQTFPTGSSRPRSNAAADDTRVSSDTTLLSGWGGGARDGNSTRIDGSSTVTSANADTSQLRAGVRADRGRAATNSSYSDSETLHRNIASANTACTRSGDTNSKRVGNTSAPAQPSSGNGTSATDTSEATSGATGSSQPTMLMLKLHRNDAGSGDAGHLHRCTGPPASHWPPAEGEHRTISLSGQSFHGPRQNRVSFHPNAIGAQCLPWRSLASRRGMEQCHQCRSYCAQSVSPSTSQTRAPCPGFLQGPKRGGSSCYSRVRDPQHMSPHPQAKPLQRKGWHQPVRPWTTKT